MPCGTGCLRPSPPFLPFRRRRPFPLREFLQALLSHLEQLHAAETLDDWAQSATAAGNLNKAEEYRQIWQLVMDVLEKADAILGKEELTLEEMAKILKAGLEKCSMGVIPPTADCLLIGDIERSRLPEIKYLFVLGVNEGVLPSPATAQGIFTEAERDLLTAQGIELASGGKQKIFEEQFLIYRGLTRPSKGLWLTYAANDAEGRELSPSSLIERLQRLDEDLQIEPMPAFDLEETAPAAVFHLLGGEMRKATAETPLSPLWQDIYGFFDENSQWQKRLSLLKQGIGKTAKPSGSPRKRQRRFMAKIFFQAFPAWSVSQAVPSPSSQNMV